MDHQTAARLAELHAALADVYLGISRETVPDRVLTLREAAVKMGMTVSWLSRRENWQRVGGYPDQDRRIKFRLSTLERYRS